MNKKCLLLTLQTLVPALFMMSKTQISSLVHEVKDTDVQTQNGCAHSCIFVIFMSVFVKPEHKSTEKLLQVFFFKKEEVFIPLLPRGPVNVTVLHLGSPL